jgi:hypothetical protein
MAGAQRTVDVVFNSSDARAITGFAVSGSLGTMPAGWSGPGTLVCAAVTTGNDCVLTLAFAPAAAGSGSLTVDYEYVDNASMPSTGHSLVIPYTATTHNNVVAAASPSGQINAAAGVGSQAVSINFTTDDGNAATDVALLTNLAALPAGWSSSATSLPCAIVSTGSGCELTLIYAPSAAGSGTLTLTYGYTDGSGAAGTGSLNIPYYATSHDNVAAVASPAGQINAIEKTGGQAVEVAFTTDDGKPASSLLVTTDLKSLPAGWSSAAAGFSCSSVSTGNGCRLPLTYAPTALTSGTFTLNYIYDDDSGAAKGGLLNITYAATTNDNVVGTAAPTGQISTIVGEPSRPLLVTFTTDDGRQATALQLTSSLAALPPGWSSTAATFSCAALSLGNACELPLTYAPTAAAGGTMMLSYSYLNNDNVKKTGTVSIPYRATTDDNVVWTAAPSSLLAVPTNNSYPVTITFTTDDGNPASALSVTSGLTALPAGWTSAATGFTCASVSAGTACTLSLTYAPTAAATGTVTLGYSYTNDSGSPKSGTAMVPYSATP